MLDFEGDGVILDCGHVPHQSPYIVQNLPSEFRIGVNNPGGSLYLTLAPTTHCAAPAQPPSTAASSQPGLQRSDPVFRPVSATCSVNTFSSKSPAEYRALITNPPAPRP